jgi:internalin A
MKKPIPLVSGLILLFQVNLVTAAFPQRSIESFAQLCQKKDSVSPGRRLTIDILLKKAGTNDCNIADRQLKNIRNLHLSGYGISDIEPLASLTNLEILNIHNNKIFDLNPLMGLRKIKTLTWGRPLF